MHLNILADLTKTEKIFIFSGKTCLLVKPKKIVGGGGEGCKIIWYCESTHFKLLCFW